MLERRLSPELSNVARALRHNRDAIARVARENARSSGLQAHVKVSTRPRCGDAEVCLEVPVVVQANGRTIAFAQAQGAKGGTQCLARRRHSPYVCDAVSGRAAAHDIAVRVQPRCGARAPAV